MQTTITIEDFKTTLASHQGNQMWKQALETINNEMELLRVLAGYIYFNSVFATGVISLAASISAKKQMLRETAAIPALADRSNEIASYVFRAAIDEFQVPSHRTLAQGTLLAAAGFEGIKDRELKLISTPGETARKTAETVANGYGHGQDPDDRGIFSGIGFHIGSELLADSEFRILDGYLQRHHAALVEYLQETTVELCGHKIPGYLWVGVHTLVEAEHRDAALQAAQLGLRWYSGDQQQAKAWVLEGFAAFSQLQTGFMSSLVDGTKFG